MRNCERRKWLGRALGMGAAVLLAWGPPQAPARAQGGDVVVFAAASLKNALDAINAQWQKETGKKASISYARQLGAGQADRAGARRRRCSSRPTSTGWTTSRGRT